MRQVGSWLGISRSRQNFSCCDRESSRLKVFCRDIVFYVATELAKPKKNYVVTEQILCCDRVGHGREKFCCDRGFLGRDRAGHDTGALSPTTEPGAHNKHACLTGMRAWQGNPVMTENSLSR